MRILATCIATVSILALFACAGPEPVVTQPPPPEHVAPADVTPPVADLAGDVVLANGFRIPGSVRGITADGLVRLTSPLFVGEHAVPLSTVDRMHFGARTRTDGRDVLTLTNGDVLRGRVEGMTADSVAFRSASLTATSLSRTGLARMELPRKGLAGLSTNFAGGQIGPWIRTPFGTSSRAAQPTAPDVAAARRPYYICAPVEHDGDFTITVEILRAPDADNDGDHLWQLHCFLPSHVKDGVRVPLFCPGSLLVQMSAGKIAFTPLGNRSLLRAKLPRRPRAKDEPTRILLRISRSVARKSISVWLNGKHLREVKLRKPPTGSFISIAGKRGWGLRRISVTRGTLAPVDAADAPATGAQALVQSHDDRRIDAETLTMHDGKVALGTATGPLTMAREDVGAIVLAGVKYAVAAPDQVIVDLSDGSLTLTPTQMTATHLLGTSPVLGSVSIRRGAIRAVHAGGRIVATPDADVATLSDGRSIHCRALGVDERGRLRFRAPWLDGEGVLSDDALKELRLCGPVPESAAADVAALTNGDILTGKMLELTEDELQFQSNLFGAHTLPTAIVAKLSHSKAMAKVAGGLTDFSAGQWGPWKPYIGEWVVDKGWLVAVRPPRTPGEPPKITALAARVDQSRGITVEVEMDAVRQKGFSAAYSIVLFADALKHTWGNECIVVTLTEKSLSVWQQSHLAGRRELLAVYPPGFGTPGEPKGTVRVAYDPKTTVLIVWFNGKQVGQCKIDNPPEVGRYVMISHGHGMRGLRYYQRMRTRWARILPQVVPPPAMLQQAPAQDAFRMFLANCDMFDARSVTMAEGTIVFTTADGELRLPLARVAQFKFPAAPRKAPPGSGHNIVVKTSRGRLTFKLTALTPEHLIGHSALLGPIKLPRKLVCSMEFLPKGN